MSRTISPPLAAKTDRTPVIARDAMKFRDKLRWLRKRQKISQIKMAEQITVPGAKVWANRMSKIENDPEARVEISLLVKIADLFGVPLSWLVDDRLGPSDLANPPGEYDKLSEHDRQVLALARAMGPGLALARLAHVPGTDTPDVTTGLHPAVTGHEVAPTLKADEEIPKKKPPGNGGASPDPKRPRRPKSRVKIAGTAHNASLGVRMARKKKLPGTPK